MKRLTLSITILLLVCSLLPTRAGCFNCTQFERACRAAGSDAYTSCIILGGNVDQCVNYADHIFIGCMNAHGCPIIAASPSQGSENPYLLLR